MLHGSREMGHTKHIKVSLTGTTRDSTPATRQTRQIRDTADNKSQTNPLGDKNPLTMR